MRTVRRLRALTLLLAAVLLLSACARPGGKPGDGELTRVRFTEVIHSIFYAPQYVAQAKGFFAEEGIQLVASTAQGSDRGVAALLAGTADIALVGPETTVFVHNQDTPNKVKIFAQLTATDGSFLVARQPNEAFSWRETRGKEIIGWRVGSMPHMVAVAILRKHGLNPDRDLTYVSNIAAPAMAGAFQSGQGDYLQVFEPIVSMLEQAGVGYQVAALGPEYGSLPYTGYVATDRYIRENADVVQRYTNAIYRAMRYVHETDPEVVAAEILQHFDGSDVALLASALRRYRENGAWMQTPVMEPADFDRLQALMVEGGVLDPNRKVPFDAIGTNRFAEEAVRRIGR